MHLPYHNHRGSAILVAMIILLLLTITTTVFLENIWSFSQSSNGIEASNKAYYNALGLIDQQLMDPSVDKYHPWNIPWTGSLSAAYGVGGMLTVSTWGSTVPIAGKWNSPFDPTGSYNLISIGDPVQLVIPDNVDWGKVWFYFRVPQTGSGAGTGVYLGSGNSWAILWTLWYTGASLFASGETNIFRFTDIQSAWVTVLTFSGTSNSGSSMFFTDFYGNVGYLGPSGANCANYSCTLKLSLIRPIPTANGVTPDWRYLPFLEYKIVFTQLPAITIPSQYMVLQSDAYDYGFLRSRTVSIPQITTNTALDFAVLQ